MNNAGQTQKNIRIAQVRAQVRAQVGSVCGSSKETRYTEPPVERELNKSRPTGNQIGGVVRQGAKKAMTNELLSEEELLRKIEGIAEYLGCNDMELKNEIMPLIESQKKAFAEYVIGENETGVITNPDSPDYGEPYVNTTADRDEQRKRAGI